MSVERLGTALQLAATGCETDRLLDKLRSSCVAGTLIGLATTLPQRHLSVNLAPSTLDPYITPTQPLSATLPHSGVTS